MKEIVRFISIWLIAVLLLGRSIPFAYGQETGESPSPASTSSSSSSSGGPPPPPSVPTVPSNPSSGSGSTPPAAVPTVPVLGGSNPTNTPVPLPSSVPTVASDPYQPVPTFVYPSGTVPESGTVSETSSSETDPVDNPLSDATGLSVLGGGELEDTDGFSGSVNDPYNVQTGANSSNSAQELLTVQYEILNKNLAVVENAVKVVSETGYNFANANTLAGQIFTGNALATTNLVNKLNSNFSGTGGYAVFNIYGAQTDDIVFELADSSVTENFDTASSTVTQNLGTGAGSSNEGFVDNGFTVKEAVGNDAVLTNDVVIGAVTGNNSADTNTLGGSIQTGDATALATILNFVNTTFQVQEWAIGVVNIFGALAGNIVIPGLSVSGGDSGGAQTMTGNQMTGAGSDNTASNTYTEETVHTTQNTADIVTGVAVDSNTGYNSASGNTLGGAIVSGNAEASIVNSTVVNNSVYDPEGTVWMVIVNEMGHWVGKIIGAPDGATTYSNGLSADVISQDGGTAEFATYTGNEQTGAFSENSAEFVESHTTETAVENTASIQNQVSVLSDTGHNSADYNTGGGTIQTGDSTSGLSLLNMANTTVTAKKVVVLFVNVLGAFFGDIVPPGEQAEPSNNYAPITGNPELEVPGTELASGRPETSWTDSAVPDQTSFFVSETIQSATESTVSETSYGTENTRGTDTSNPSLSIAYGPERFVERIASGSRSSGNPSEAGTYEPVNVAQSVYLSPEFTKAVESSFPGSLFQGARFHVAESWLSVIPAAVLFVMLRKKKFPIRMLRMMNRIGDVVL